MSQEDGDQQLQLRVLASPAERYIGIELGTDGEWWEDGGMGGWGNGPGLERSRTSLNPLLATGTQQRSAHGLVGTGRPSGALLSERWTLRMRDS